MKLTIGQQAAIDVLNDPTRITATESNHTDPTAGTIHWQPLGALIRKGLLKEVGWNGTGRIVALTDTGRKQLTP